MMDLPFLLLVLVAGFHKHTAAILDVMVAGKEVQRFLNFDLNTNLVIVKDGRISPLLRSPQFSKVWPTIRADINDLELKFVSPKRVEYVLSLRSSDKRIMPTPRANIPLRGRVPRRMTTFKIYFPCSGKRTGEVKLFIDIQFFGLQSKQRSLPPINIPLKRKCVKERPRVQPRKGLRSCQKSCTMDSLKTEFCISDFVVRAKIERFENKGGKKRYYVRVTKKYKRGRIRIRKKHQALEVKGTKLSCNCQKLKIGQVYLIFGREDRRDDTLFIDNYTISMQWSKKCKRFARTNRKQLNCPPRLAMNARYRI
eukprot:Seg42.3 transcript_id=Seg42.3/GoldUCD/mRNA.D3Y31 product="Wnt inhibitory factor 1" protein_id=Seg42.3/GoldUCD/D3Y31